MKKKRIPPKPGQESVWDYPRPPRLESTAKHVRIVHGDVILADTNQAYRLLETSHPPVYYLPPSAIRMDLLEQQTDRQSFCEFKGAASYWNILIPGHERKRAAWSYPQPSAAYQALAGYLAFYPSQLDACYVADERVQAQEGDFYGGWITADIVGPFKGATGTWGW